MFSSKKIFIFLFSILFLIGCKTTKTSLGFKNNEKDSNFVLKIISEARKYKGVKYKYGGNDYNGIDCSGLLCNVFKAQNIILPRVSHKQAEFFPANDVRFVRKGDLIFFVTSGENISHAGIVTDVKNEDEIMFIHASTSKGVIEDNLKINYWWSRFARVCRPSEN